jgi:hypothetical protein
MPMLANIPHIVLALLMLLAPQVNVLAQDIPGNSQRVRLVGSIVDADTLQPIPARVYVRDPQGNWLYVRSASQIGVAWPYSEEWVPMPQAVERHTTVSAHPFVIDLAPGEYEIIIERGKEYLPWHENLKIPAADSSRVDESEARTIEQIFSLQRWSEMAGKGWYSGETHVHRRMAELPNVMEAEELNVAFPVTFWTTSADKAPNLEPSRLRAQGPSPFGPREDLGFEPLWIDEQRVILPRNTEYEIFSIGPKNHTLGALFILNHRQPFTQLVPPVGPVVAQARREGALLDLDKHNWPWSLMLVPVAQVDLFELSNNSVWRTNFGFKQAGHALPPWKEFEHESPGLLTEWGWLEFGFEMYYALLNCGFRLSPTAGTASGVHPVPLGHSRVYVHTGNEFKLDAWLAGLQRGRSFVTTGPMLVARIEDQLPGEVFELGNAHSGEFNWEVEVVSPDPITRVELLVNGRVAYSTIPESKRTDQGAWMWSGQGVLSLAEAAAHRTALPESNTDRAAAHNMRSGWAVVRAWCDQPDGRKRFAHTGAWFFEVEQQPVYPPRQQIDYLLDVLEAALEKQRGVLPPEALAEFEQARETYRQLQSQAYADPVIQRRPVVSESDERFWLENMFVWHRYSLLEMSQVLGKGPAEIRELLEKYQLFADNAAFVPPAGRQAVQPYPGGRHPRRGFLDGSIAPQRETKFSLFTPWSAGSYVVADVPEAIFSNLGLIYLAHTHIPTVWDQQGKSLPVQEWQREEGGVLKCQRTLPNGIRFEVSVVPTADHVRMELALFNGTPDELSGLRVQHCMMLAHAVEFDIDSNDNKLFYGDYGLVHNPERKRWLITSWKPLGRAWGNPPVPCLHTDPILPDCPPGETTRAQGWLSFYEGDDWQAEIERIESLRWWLDR